MEVIRVAETSFDIPAKDILLNIDDFLEKKIKNEFLNTYYGNVYVNKIDKIIRRSSIFLNRSKTNGNGTINVQFQYSGFIIKKDDNLSGFVIKLKKDDKFILKKYQLVAFVEYHKILSDLDLEMIIPITVKSVRQKSKSLWIKATIYMPPDISFIYKIESPDFKITSLEIDKIKKKYSSNMGSKKWKFFEDILQVYPMPKSAKLIDFTKIKQNDIICLHPTINFAQDKVMKLEKEDIENERGPAEKKYGLKYVEEDSTIIKSYLLEKYDNFLNFINQLTEDYTDKERLNSQPLWDFYKNFKKKLSEV